MKKYFVSLKNVAGAVSTMPEVVGFASALGIGTLTLSGWIVADIHRRELADMKTVDPDVWPTIEISPDCMKDLEEGATLKYRQIRIEPNRTYCQFTTLDEFPDEANEKFNKEEHDA